MFHSGTASCYCEHLIENDLENLYNYENTFIYEMKDGTLETRKEPLCAIVFHDYVSSTSVMQIYALLFSQFVVINAVWIRMLVIFLAKKLRIRCLTTETKFILLTVFYFYMLNYAGVYLIAPLDFKLLSAHM